MNKLKRKDMFTGKAKELFEKWMKPNPLEHGRYGQLISNTFDSMPLSMQWGVIQDFADSLGQHMETVLEEWGFDMLETIHVTSFKIGIHESEFNYDTRQEARTAAINKLNQLINEI